MIGVIASWLCREPLQQLVAQEAQLAAAGEPVARQLSFPNESAEVLDVHLEQLGGHRCCEDGRELLHRLRGRIGATA